MVGPSLLRSPHKAGGGNMAAKTVAGSVRTFKPRSVIQASSKTRGRPVFYAGSGATSRGGNNTNEVRKARRGKNKVLNWFRLPATGAWVPSARAGHTAVTVGTNMIVFGGVVNGVRVNELAIFDLNVRVWRRGPLPQAAPSVAAAGCEKTSATGLPITPVPRAFHASWVFGADVYIHGGEGFMGGTMISNTGNVEFEDILGQIGRDPFAEEDEGAPLVQGRVLIVGCGRRDEKKGCDKDGSGGMGGSFREGWKGKKEKEVTWSDAAKKSKVSVLEDLWKLDSQTHQWERLSSRLAPLGRKGHTATIAPFRGQPWVFIFGGAPAERRGLSNALYSVDLPQLSVGEGTWERHRPGGTAPAPRQGHSFTAVAGGTRLVLFGGVAESGELLGDVHVLEIDGGRLSWASVQPPVGDVPAARHSHSACEVPAGVAYVAGIKSGAGIIVFGGEGRAGEAQEIRSTDSHEVFLYDPEASRWQAVETGHAFPIGRHGHSLAVVAGWIPPSFHPDGTLTAAELSPSSRSALSGGSPSQHPAERGEKEEIHMGNINTAKPGVVSTEGGITVGAAEPSEAAKFQWGNSVPSCAVVFGGLNSMYVNPDVWILPLGWRKKAVQFFPPSPMLDRKGKANKSERGNEAIAFATTVKLEKAAAAAAVAARHRVVSSAHGRRKNISGEGGTGRAVAVVGDCSRRTWQPGDACGGVGVGVGGGGSGGGSSSGKNIEKHRRNTCPTGGFSGGEGTSLVIDTFHRDHEQRHVVAAGDGDRQTEDAKKEGGFEVERWDEGGDGVLESAAEIELELIRLRRIAYFAGQKLSVEVSSRMHLEAINEGLRKEAEEFHSIKEATEKQLREEAKRQRYEEQKVRARCGSLEGLLAEAYELINMSELQHHLQVKSLMHGLYGNLRLARASHSHPASQDQLHHGESSDGDGAHSCHHDNGSGPRSQLEAVWTNKKQFRPARGSLPLALDNAARSPAENVGQKENGEDRADRKIFGRIEKPSWREEVF